MPLLPVFSLPALFDDVRLFFSFDIKTMLSNRLLLMDKEMDALVHAFCEQATFKSDTFNCKLNQMILS